MSEIEYAESEVDKNAGQQQHKIPLMVRWVLKSKVVEKESSAELVLLGMAMAFLMITLFIFFVLLFKRTPEPLPYDDLSERQKEQIPRDFYEAQLRNRFKLSQ